MYIRLYYPFFGLLKSTSAFSIEKMLSRKQGLIVMAEKASLTDHSCRRFLTRTNGFYLILYVWQYSSLGI
jgi:hypothetical protein